MVDNIDKKIGSEYSESKLNRMRKAWPSSLKKAIKIVQIELNSNILNAFSDKRITSLNNKIKPKKEIKTKGMSK